MPENLKQSYIERHEEITKEAFARAEQNFAAAGPPVAQRSAVAERLKLVRNVPLEEYRTAVPFATVPVKETLVSADRISQRFAHELSTKVYVDMDAFMTDVIAIEREMFGHLIAAGCRYIQIDAPGYTAYGDDVSLERMRSRGEDPLENLDRAIRADNAIIAGFDDVCFGIHLCRGNVRTLDPKTGHVLPQWHRVGTYDSYAEKLFSELHHDRFLLEYDTERAGGFEPLRFVPKDKIAVLGLVSTKTEAIESIDLLERRIAEASKHKRARIWLALQPAMRLPAARRNAGRLSGSRTSGRNSNAFWKWPGASGEPASSDCRGHCLCDASATCRRPVHFVATHHLATPNDGFKAVYYAAKSGIFTKHGLDVTVALINSGAAAAAALIGGAADVAYTNITTLILAHNKGVPMQIIAPGALFESEQRMTTAIVVLKDSPFRSGADLNGKTIGSVSLGDTMAASIQAYVDQSGGDSKTIKIIEVPAAASIEALQAGRISAATMNEPAVSQSLATGNMRTLTNPNASISKRFLEALFAVMGPVASAKPGRDATPRSSDAGIVGVYERAHGGNGRPCRRLQRNRPGRRCPQCTVHRCAYDRPGPHSTGHRRTRKIRPDFAELSGRPAY